MIRLAKAFLLPLFAFAILAVASWEAPREQSVDLLVAYAGDVQGLLEDCG